MVKDKKKKQEVKIVHTPSNPKVDEIVKDYPESLYAHPRAAFEDQLKRHLLKHHIK